MKKLFTSKVLFLLFCIGIFGLKSIGQTNIFSENMGVPTATTSIAVYATGTAPATFQNKGILTYSNGAVATAADVRATSVSSTYPGFSAGGNIFFTSTSGAYGFSIESINASSYSNLSLQFGYRKESAALHATFAVEYSDGAAWVVIANTPATLFNETATAAVGWYLSKPLSLPATAQIAGLKIRFVKSGTASIRLDDVKLTGIAFVAPTLSSISPSSANAGDPGFTLTVNGANFVSGSSVVTWNGTAMSTTFVSATQLTATIPAANIATAGTANVGVTTGSLSSATTLPFAINAVSGGNLTLVAALPAFGNLCINTTSPENSFTINGNNLDGSNLTIAPVAGYTFSETSGGTFTTSLSIAYAGTSITGKIIYVKFTPTLVQSYATSILINGGSVNNYPVAANGTGINDAPSITTIASSAVGATIATAAGTITTIGCAPVTAYGIEYSSATGFPNGTGTQVPSSNLSGGNFTAAITGLAPNTRYYYKAYATNSVGTSYGTQLSFTATPLPVPMAAQPLLSYTETFADIANWSSFFITGINANHFSGLGATVATGIPNGTSLTASTLFFQSVNAGPPVTPGTGGGVHRGTDQVPASESIVLLSTGSGSSPNFDNTTAAAFDFYMDFTGVNGGTLSFDYNTLNNSTGNRNGSLRVYATVDGITFTELTFASVLDFTNNVPISGSKTNIALPAIFNNSATARLRFYYHNGSGNTGSGSRPKIAIDNLNVTAVANTPCVNPTAPASGLSFGTITDVSIQGSFTAVTPSVDQYIIVMSVNNSLTGNPVNGQIYNIGDNLGDGTLISNSATTNFTTLNLTPLTTYYFFIFPVNSVCTGGPLYYSTTVLNGSATTIAGLPNCVAPSAQPSNLIFTSSTTNTINGSFTGSGANEYLILRSTSTTLTTSPTNGQSYNAGNILGNAVVVQRNASTTFAATGLLPNTTYYFFVFALNNQACINGPIYITANPLNNSQATLPLPNCVAPTTQPTNLVLTISNTAIAGTFNPAMGTDSYIIVRSTSPTLSATPIDNTTYNNGDALGGGIIVANTQATSFVTTNLLQNTTYYFFVFAQNKNCTGGPLFLSINSLTGNATTTNVPANNFYFGNLHAHSDYSDGNQDNPGYTPAQDYAYAQTAQCMDFLGISEHNHFSTVDNPGNQISNYHLGSAQANAYTTTNPGFLAMYGMEWGVISGGGHVIIYGDGMDDLFGWETGSGAWGTTNNYDVYVPKNTYTGSTGLFKTINDKVAQNTFATLAHPNLFDYNGIGNTAPYDIVADNAIVGSAIETGPASSTNTTYSNPGSSLLYLWYYQLMLSKGYHLGPTMDHDNHKTTFGKTTYSRTAVVSPSLSKTAIVSAIRNMHFYATQDCDSKVDFTINTKILGSIFTDKYAPNIAVTLTDATTTTSSAKIILWHGISGSGSLPVAIDSAIGSSLIFTDNNLANLSTGYYYVEITNGTGKIITAPIWYTRNDAGTVTPVTLSFFTVQKNDNKAKIEWVTEQEINSSKFIVERSTDGRTWSSIATVNATGNSTTRNTYSIIDYAPLKGINYYRLKQIDIDGKFEYSVVRSAIFNLAYNIIVSPNPAIDFINVSINKTDNKNIQIQIADMSGKVIRNVISNQSLTSISTNGIAKGMYLVKVINEQIVSTRKIMIQ
jgi:trimeric autotransporter adhesin